MQQSIRNKTALPGAAIGIALASGCALLAGGCGGAKPPYQIAPVSGKVTFEDGSPISSEPVSIFFHPQVPAVSEKEHPRAASGRVDPKDGSFVLTTLHHEDGAIVGPNKITFGPAGLTPPNVPDEYLSPLISPLEVEVKPGSNTFSDLKVPKPTKASPKAGQPKAK